MNVDIRSLNEKMDRNQQAVILRRLRHALGRFRDRIARVTVRLEDLNGPRGGLDKQCNVEAKLAAGGTLMATVRDFGLEAAISKAADRLARQVRDTFAMRRDVHRRHPAAHRVPA